MLRSTDLVGRVIGARYRLLRPVGSGASAFVYVAEDVRLRRRVAVKVLHPALAEDRAFLRRFQAEAQTVAGLRHPSILRVYDWGEDAGEAYLVMELLEGGSLRAFLDTGARLTVSQAAAIGLDAASALAYAHARGLVHRDIKPANLLFDDEGHMNVADFGIARALAEASWTEPWGAMVGTARYAAPEQLRAVALDGRADVYALAMVLVEAVTGTVPFSLDTTLGALLARADQPLPVPPEMGALGPALTRAGTPAPDGRLTAEELALAIARAATELRAPSPLVLPALSHPVGEDVRADRTELAHGRRSPGHEGLSILVDDLPPEVLQEAPAPVAPGHYAPEGPIADLSGAPRHLVTASPGKAEPGTPTGRRRRRWVTALVLIIVLALLGGGGAAAYVLVSQPLPTYPVPVLKGEGVRAATAALDRQHLRLSVIGSVWASSPAGTVMSQKPVPGTRLEAHQQVVVTVSKGRQPVAVPDMATLDLAQAKKALVAARLTLGHVTHQTSMTIAAGVVISWSHQGQDLRPGTAVDLVLSTGKPMAVVPPIGPATATFALMSAALVKVGLEAVQATTWSDSVPDGQVISVYPAPGASEVVGTKVTVTTSMGPHMVAVPGSIIGLSTDAAAKVLQNAGLYSDGVEGNNLAAVTGSDPAVGTSVHYGSGVILVTG